MFWFKKKEPVVVEKIIYKVVEVKAPRTNTKWSKEIKDAVSTLPSHPGFIALMERQELHRQMLAHKCAHEYHKDQRESDYLQAGIFWLGYAQRLVDGATKLPLTPTMDAFDEEMEEFKQIDSTNERIGMEQPQAAEVN